MSPAAHMTLDTITGEHGVQAGVAVLRLYGEQEVHLVIDGVRLVAVSAGGGHASHLEVTLTGGWHRMAAGHPDTVPDGGVGEGGDDQEEGYHNPTDNAHTDPTTGGHHQYYNIKLGLKQYFNKNPSTDIDDH